MQIPTIIHGPNCSFIIPAGYPDNGYMLGCEYDGEPRYPVPANIDVRLAHDGDAWAFMRQCAWLG